ncbi:MAG: 50S ribosomal protein L18 [Candidatus Heimdallarchaeota archaeon]|nr:50S ribosomal protein L18 [Candidatus Heimdallarchaeota archaeon]
MAKGPRYRVPLRRRREGKTDFYSRRELLKSGRVRAVIRKSSKNMQIQFVEALPDGDKTLASSNSLQLKDFGWNITGGNIPAAYVTGYLAGKRALAAGIDDAIADLGLQVRQKGGRIYAALKGIIDAGLEIPASDIVFPEEDILKGAHLKNTSEELRENFARYKEAKQNIDELDKLVEKTIKAIDKKF